MELFSIRIQRTFQLVSTGNAEAPDDDHCNPDHVGNLSFLVCP